MVVVGRAQSKVVEVSAYILRRLLLMIPTLIGVMAISFFITEFVPGGPVDQVKSMMKSSASNEIMMMNGMDAKRWQSSPAVDNQLKQLYGLDRPRWERFFRTFIWYTPDPSQSAWKSFVNLDHWHGLFLFKFGRSMVYNQTVWSLIQTRLPISLSLGFFSFWLTYGICLCLGILKAIWKGTRWDSWTTVFILIGYSIPGFVLAVLLVVYFGPGPLHWVRWIPLDGGLTSAEVTGYAQWSVMHKLGDYLQHLWAPVVCLSLGSFAVLTLLVRNSILNQMHQLYVTAARARGLSESDILWRHVLRNALIPLITGFPSAFLGMFFTGSLLIEKIFGLNGLGLLSYESIVQRDFPVVLGSLFIFTVIGLIGQLMTDVAYVWIDPRIGFEENR